MKQLIIGAILALISYCCSSERQEETQICNEFEFKNFSSNTNNWRSEITFNHIGPKFYKEYIIKCNYFENIDSSDLFFVCEVNRNKMKGIVVVIHLHTYLRMLYIPKNGRDPFLLAEYYFFIDEGIVSKSRLIKTDQLIRTTIKHNWENGFYNKDSINTIYLIDKRGSFKKLQSDSSRITHEPYK